MIKWLICKSFLTAFIIASLGSCHLRAQSSDRGFQLSLLAGANFSQLDGDKLYGFDHLGARLGVQIRWPISKEWSLSTSLLYEGRGSANQIQGGPQRTFISLRYVSIPIGVLKHIWYDEDLGLYKIHIIGSLIPARLLDVDSSHNNFAEQERYKDWDLSARLGVQYYLSRRIAVDLGLERSFLGIYEVPASTIEALQSYQINIGLQYALSH